MRLLYTLIVIALLYSCDNQSEKKSREELSIEYRNRALSKIKDKEEAKKAPNYAIMNEARKGNQLYRIETRYCQKHPYDNSFIPLDIVQVFYIDKDRNLLIIKKPLVDSQTAGFPPSDRLIYDLELNGKYRRYNGNTYFDTSEYTYEFMSTQINLYATNSDLYDYSVHKKMYKVESTKKVDEYLFDSFTLINKNAFVAHTRDLRSVSPD